MKKRLYLQNRTLFTLILLILFPVSKSIYSDECISGNCQNGLSTLFFSNGDKYTGNFKNGKQNGRGMMTFAAKPDASGNFIYASKYSGEFKDEKFHGRGKYKYADGELYVGEFKDDRFHGIGVLNLKNGDRYEPCIFITEVNMKAIFGTINLMGREFIFSQMEINTKANSKMTLNTERAH